MIQTLLLSAGLLVGQSAEGGADLGMDAAGAAAVAAAQLPVMVDIKPGVWLMRVRGDSSFGGGTFKLDETMGVDSLNAAFRGELTIQHTDWAVKLMGTTINAGGSVETTGGTWGGVGLTAGDETSFNMSWLQFEGHWTAWTLLGDGRRDTNEALDLSLGPHLAVSWIDIEEKLTPAIGASATASGGWWSVMGGAQVSMQADMRKFSSWLYQLRVDVSGHVGTTIDKGGFAWAVQGGLTMMFTPNIGATVGYRLMEFNDLESDGWTVSPRFPGLFLGANVSF